MTILEAIIFGAVQGIAEFLPISSSGHLVVLKELFNLKEIPLIFDVLLHVSTLAAVVIFFWKQIAELFAVLYRWIARKAKDDDVQKQKTIIALILGTIVTGVIGILFSKFIPELPSMYVYIGFLVTAILLIVSSIVSRREIENKGSDTYIKPVKGLLIGFAQGLGTLPGISRSGITISTALMSEIDRKKAGEFSFLLSIPAILGAFILEAKDLTGVTESVGMLPLFLGCLGAFIFGLLALKFLMRIVSKGKLEYFACYLIPLGVLGLIFLR